MGVLVKDKVYYMAERLGIPKSWIPIVLDVSDTTLTKWSYNPKNVSEEMSERIFLRVAILDKLNVKIIPGHWKIPLSDCWLVSVDDDTYYIQDRRRRLPSMPPKQLTCLIRNAIIREENQNLQYVKHRYKERNGPLSTIAKDTSLEMPLGVIRWEKDI